MQTGGAAATALAEPLGTSQIEVFGTLTAQGPAGSFAANAANIILRNTGTLSFDNNSNGPYTGSGSNGRWNAANAGLTLNGGTLQLLGAAGSASNMDTFQSIGALNVNQSGTVAITPEGKGNATLTVASITAQSGPVPHHRGHCQPAQRHVELRPLHRHQQLERVEQRDQRHGPGLGHRPDGKHVRIVQHHDRFPALGRGHRQCRTRTSTARARGVYGDQTVQVTTGSATVASNQSLYALNTNQGIAGAGTVLTVGSGGVIGTNVTIAPTLAFGSNEGLVYSYAASNAWFNPAGGSPGGRISFYNAVSVGGMTLSGPSGGFGVVNGRPTPWATSAAARPR